MTSHCGNKKERNLQCEEWNFADTTRPTFLTFFEVICVLNLSKSRDQEDYFSFSSRVYFYKAPAHSSVSVNYDREHANFLCGRQLLSADSSEKWVHEDSFYECLTMMIHLIWQVVRPWVLISSYHEVTILPLEATKMEVNNKSVIEIQVNSISHLSMNSKHSNACDVIRVFL